MAGAVAYRGSLDAARTIIATERVAQALAIEPVYF
jgi:hypothetical protein